MKKFLAWFGSLFSWLGNLLVKAPKCKGPDVGAVGASILFTVKSGYEKLSDDYLYSFDFGDGTPVTELTEGKKLRKQYGTLGMTHVFTTPGTKKVKVREKCPYDAHDKWSEDHDITIKAVPFFSVSSVTSSGASCSTASVAWCWKCLSHGKRRNMLTLDAIRKKSKRAPNCSALCAFVNPKDWESSRPTFKAMGYDIYDEIKEESATYFQNARAVIDNRNFEREPVQLYIDDAVLEGEVRSYPSKDHPYRVALENVGVHAPLESR